MERDLFSIMLTMAVMGGVVAWYLTRMWYRYKFKKFLKAGEMWSPGMEDTSPFRKWPWNWPAEQTQDWLDKNLRFHKDLAKQVSDCMVQRDSIGNSREVADALFWLYCTTYLLNLDIWIIPHKYYEQMKEATQGKDGFCQMYSLILLIGSVSLMALAAFLF